MKQLLQNLRSGKTSIADVPIPSVQPGRALVHNAFSVVSAGTERTLVEFAEKNLVGKARARPDLVRQVLDKAQREGIIPTIQAAFNRLDQPMPLGYSSAGTIIDVGEGMPGFKAGDRVACAGSGFAVHAEYVLVPKNLMVHLPDRVDFESAAFTTLGAIAMQGFRLAQPQVGESVAVIGLGLLGLLTTGIARAAGCRVFGVDLDQDKVNMAAQFGATAVLRVQAEESGMAFTQNRGFDIVLICADSRSNDPVELAGKLARDRGTVIAVGAVGLNIPRKPYYEKEIQFRVSRSYGPGRYDPAYEERGQDYPAGYIRWTEGRNMASFVDLLESQALDVHPLISHCFPIEQAGEAYEIITGKSKTPSPDKNTRGVPVLGVLLSYPQNAEERTTRINNPVFQPKPLPPIEQPGLGVLGAGNYANVVFLPAVKKTGGINRIGIATASGLSASHASKKFGFQYSTSTEDEILTNPDINIIAILTRHNLHARQVAAALSNGKHVYCEKPLALNQSELADIFQKLTEKECPTLMVGFNRRFAPLSVRLKDFLETRHEPFIAHYRVNAGYLPLNHWLHDPHTGGGRIIGEGCHFIDFLTFLAGSPPIEVIARTIPEVNRYHQDNVTLTFSFPDGSIGTVSYLANGDKSFAKEYLEVFSGGSIAVLNDFRSLELVKNGRRTVYHSRFTQNKGHLDSWKTFLNAIKTGSNPPIPYDHLYGVTIASFAASRAMTVKESIPIPYHFPAL